MQRAPDAPKPLRVKLRVKYVRGSQNVSHELTIGPEAFGTPTPAAAEPEVQGAAVRRGGAAGQPERAEQLGGSLKVAAGKPARRGAGGVDPHSV